MQTALRLQTSEQKPLQDPISNLNFYLQLHIPCTFHWDPLGQPVKITSENTQRWQHRTGGSLFESNIQNSAQNDKLRIYLPWRWGDNLTLALNVREAGAAGIAAIAAT